MIASSSTSSYGWWPLWLQTENSLKEHCVVATVRAKHWSQLPIMNLHADYQITTLPINCNTLGYQFIISQNIPTPQRAHTNKFTSYLFHYTLKAVSMLINFKCLVLSWNAWFCASLITLWLSIPSGVGPITEQPISTSNLWVQKASHVQLESAWYSNSQLKQLVVDCF